MRAIQYGIYLTAENTTIRFPVNPQELPIEYPQENESYDVLALGEIVQPRKPGLAKISWEDGLLPGSSNSPYVLTAGDFEPPEFYIKFLNRCKTLGIIGTLTIDRRYEDGTPFHSDTFSVVVGAFTVTEKGAETGDFYYSITFTEYRNYLPGSVTLETKASGSVAAVTKTQRSVPSNQLVVGSKVTVSGVYCYTSAGGKPHGTGSGRTAVVSRILTSSAAYPVLLRTAAGGLLGWCKKDAVTVQ